MSNFTAYYDDIFVFTSGISSVKSRLLCSPHVSIISNIYPYQSQTVDIYFLFVWCFGMVATFFITLTTSIKKLGQHRILLTNRCHTFSSVCLGHCSYIHSWILPSLWKFDLSCFITFIFCQIKQTCSGFMHQAVL